MPFNLSADVRYPRNSRRYQSLRPPPPRIGTHRRNKPPSPEQLNVAHKDLILDVRYDHYGSRMATCSYDQWVRIWDMDFRGKWHCNSAWKAHCAPIWRITWCDPEFGQIVATCSFDRSACIWEETTSQWGTDVRLLSNWVKRYTFTESRLFASVSDLKFAPRMYGLACAMTSEDGYIRIYDAPDLLDLSFWQMNYEVNIGRRLSALSWCQSIFRLHCPLFAVASDDAHHQGSKIEFFERNEYTREWQAICADEWNGVSDVVRDISFQSNLARANDLLAVVTHDYLQLIYIELKFDDDGDGPNESVFATQIGPDTQARIYDIRTVAILRDSMAPIWRVAWNFDGKVVITAAEDGYVRLYRCMSDQQWMCYSIYRPGSDINRIAHELYLHMTAEQAIEVVPGMKFD